MIYLNFNQKNSDSIDVRVRESAFENIPIGFYIDLKTFKMFTFE